MQTTQTPAQTVSPARAEAQARATRKTRSDFKTWAEWCEYRKQRCLRRANRAMAQAETWEKLKAGEHLKKQLQLERKLAKLLAEKAKLEAEVAQAKA